MVIKAIVHVPTGEFKNKQGLSEAGPFEPSRPLLSADMYDPDYDVVIVPRMPDPRTERWDGTAIVAKTAQDINAYDVAQRTTRFTATSRQKDVLATCALIVRAKNTPAWNAMTVDQKKTATFNEADVWTNIRDFIETNL